jgi:elongation factor P
MDVQSFEQFDLGREDLGESADYLIDGIEGVRSVHVQGRIADVQLPNTVDLLVTEADPAIKGATAQAQLKKARTETGLEVLVPSYVVQGEKIRVDTRDGNFVERAK